MMLRIKSDKIITDGKLFDGYVYIENGVITKITAEENPADESYDFTGKYVSPGFIDTHTHGGLGVSFYNSSEEDVIKACNFHLAHGTTTICPTVIACAYDEIVRSLEFITAAIFSGKINSNVPGAHIEGPYLSKEQCGAQVPKFITPPIKNEYESIVERFGKYVKRWTYAPENDKNGDFCRYITSHGIIASAGHSNAKYEDMCVAIENGCNLITHLYSCVSTVTRDHGFRSLGVIESTYLRDELNAEIICDGKHLPPELIKMIIKIKGSDKVILTTDSIEAAGTEDLRGRFSDTEYIIEDGVAKLTDRSAFAGSIATADVLIRTLTKECGYCIPESVKMLTENPAKLLGLKKGEIRDGFDADIVIFDEEINVSDVFVMGKKI